MAKWTARLPITFPSLLRRLRVVLPPEGAPFDLTGNVVPVAIVDPLPLVAVAVDPAFDTPFTAGVLIAPLALTRLANTGPLPEGAYQVTIWAQGNEGNSFELARRNAADAADVWRVRWFTVVGALSVPLLFRTRFVLRENERLVIENVNAGAGGVPYFGAIWALLS